MRKKKLYEVNRFNKPSFQFENVFDGLTMGSNQMYNWNSSIDRGRAIADASRLSYYNQQKQNGSVGQQEGSSGGNNGFAWASAAAGSAEGIGAARNREYSSAANNGFSTVDSTLAGGKKSEAGVAGVNTGASLMNAGLQSNNKGLIIAGGLAGAIGTGVNLLTGVKEDTDKLNAVNQNINQNRNFRSDAKHFDDVVTPVAALTDTDIYDTAPFASSKWREKEKKLKEQMLAAADWADRSVGNNIYNIKGSQLNDALANYSAYGGPMVFNTGAVGLMQQDKYFDTINKRSDALAGKGGMQTAFTGGAKTFDEGGLKTSFLDDFGKDPIAAAVRYNQGLEALAAQEEERKMAAAREAEYANMQNRLLSLETQNQGLQALLAAQSVPTPSVTDVTTESVEAAPEPSYAPSAAGYNSNWDYIEDQLRRSGKFNDIQIEGIKYNLQRESGIDPDAVGDGGQALGLGQWHGSRQPKDRSLEGQTRHLIDTLSNYDGTQHWIGRGNYEGFLNARTPEEAHYYITKGYERPANYILAKVKRDSDKSLRNINAFGGELGTNGTDFTNGLLYVDEGGTHEENPLDGVPMGLDPQGVPNLVEEGETVYDNYVFSNRLTVPNFMLKDLGLPNSKKKITFADASKKLAKESEKRPNDPISNAGLEASLARLAEIQETERMRKQAKEYTGLENVAAYGGDLGNMYDGTGIDPNILDKSNTSFARRMFGDNEFTDFLEKAASAVGDPIGYFAGDEIDAVMNKIAQMSEPQLEKFFATPVGQYVAKAIENTSGNSSNVQEAGMQRWAKATGRMAKPIQKTIVNSAKRALAQSKLQARGQMKTPKGGGKPTTLTETQTPVQTARKAITGSTEGLPEGWSIGNNIGNASSAARTQAFQRGLPKDTFDKGFGSARNLAGTMDFAAPVGSGNFGYLPWIVGGGAGAGALYGLSSYLTDNLESGNTDSVWPTNTQQAAAAVRSGVVSGATKGAANTNAAQAATDKPQGTGLTPEELQQMHEEQIQQRRAAATQAQSRRAASTGTTRSVRDNSSARNYGNDVSDSPADTSVVASVAPGMTDDEFRTEYPMIARPADTPADNGIDWTNGSVWEGLNIPPQQGKKEDVVIDSDKPKTYDTWMRYAPAVGSGLMALTDALGITNKPDYTMADKLEASAERAGYAPNISYDPIGDYLRYVPMDIWYEQNRMDANTRATDRALLNTSSPSKAAGLLANGYNSQIANGNLYRQALEYNDAKRERVADFNRKTNMFNSQMGLEADMANARYQQAASQMGLSGLAQAAALRDQIDARTGAAKSANLTNFLTSLGNIGRENFAMNQINWDRSRRYKGRLNGTSGYTAKNGGKLNRK